MKICIWFGLIAVDYTPPNNQILFVDGDLLTGLGPRQCEERMVETTISDAEGATGLYLEDIIQNYKLDPECRLWFYNDNNDGDGFTALFVDLDDLRK